MQQLNKQTMISSANIYSLNGLPKARFDETLSLFTSYHSLRIFICFQKPWVSGDFCLRCWIRSSPTPRSSGRSGSACFSSSGSWSLELEQRRSAFTFSSFGGKNYTQLTCLRYFCEFWPFRLKTNKQTPSGGYNKSPHKNSVETKIQIMLW